MRGEDKGNETGRYALRGLLTRYIEAFHWPDYIEDVVSSCVTEAPLLNVCSGESEFGDVRVDRYHFKTATMKASADALPFRSESFAAVFRRGMLLISVCAPHSARKQ